MKHLVCLIVSPLIVTAYGLLVLFTLSNNLNRLITGPFPADHATYFSSFPNVIAL